MWGTLAYMDATLTNACGERPERRPTLTLRRFTATLWDSAWEALVWAFFIRLFGSIALGILGGIFGEMTPSLPPGWAGKPLPEAVPSPIWDAFRTGFSQHQFATLVVVIWVARAASRLARFSQNKKYRRAAAWLVRASHRIGDEWFGLLVSNAFAAFFGVMILQWSQAFSVAGWLWGAVGDLLSPLTHAIMGVHSSGGLFHALASLFSWYGDNQFKFAFWLLFSAGICDDLGLPNYKSLARWLWCKLRRRFAPSV